MLQFSFLLPAQNPTEIEAFERKLQGNLGKAPQIVFQMAQDLLVEAQSENSPKKEAIAWYHLSAVYVRENKTSQGLECARKSLDAAELSGDSLQVSHSYNILGNVYEAMGNADSALYYYEASLELGKLLQRDKEVARSLLNVGLIYLGLGRFPKGLEVLHESLKISKRHNYDGYYPNIYLTLGEIYFQIEDFEAANENFYLGLTWSNLMNNQKFACRAMYNLGEYHVEVKDSLEALCWFKAAITLAREQNLPAMEARASARVALIYSTLGDDDAAGAAAKKAIEIGTRDGDRITLGLAYQINGLLDLKQGKARSAYHNCKKSYAIAQETQQSTAMVELCACLWKSAERLGDYKAAFTHYRDYIRWEDSLVGENNSLAIARIEAQLEYDGKVLRDSLSRASINAKRELDYKLERANNAVREQKFLWLGSFLIFLVLAAIIGLIIFRKQNQKLSWQNLQIQQQSASIQSNLDEKEVLLSEVHHRVKNNLQVMSSLLEMQAMASIQADSKAILLESQARVQAMAMIHQLLYEGDNFASMNFAEYLSQMSDSLKKIHDLSDSVTVEIVAEDLILSSESSVALGLVANELIINAFKHAFGPSMQQGILKIVFFASQENKVQLVVEDNGLNFDPEILNQSTTRLGLKLIKGLCRQLKGSVGVEQSSLGGTKFVVSIIDMKKDG